MVWKFVKFACLFLILNLVAAFSIKNSNTNSKISSKIKNHTWYYSSVIKNSKPLFEITQGDSIHFTDSLFNYIIQKPGKIASGKFEIIEAQKDSSPLKCALKFTYNPAKNIRVFYLQKLSKKELVIRENGVTFNYSNHN